MMPWWYYGYWNPWAWRMPWYGGMFPWSLWGASPYGTPWGAMPKEQEIAMLEDQAKALEADLESIRKRLEELRK